MEDAILVFVFQGEAEAEKEKRIAELREIAHSAGARVRAVLAQERSAPSPATLIGKGKLQEVKDLVTAEEIGLVIFEASLTGAQRKHLSEALDCKLLDRVDLILDLFAHRAQSKKSKLEVHLAQLEYRLPRLRGYGTALSRTGGGIGTRGPGEQKLESDRRTIERQITAIKRKLALFSGQEAVAGKRKRASALPLVVMTGYTNVGKSTLMNRLLEAYGQDISQEKQVYADDRLFATLETATRRIQKPGEAPFLLVDTVGFIHDLPEKLKRSFESTLEEVMGADLLLLLLDGANPSYETDLHVVEKTLRSLGNTAPILYVMNKMDQNQPALVTPKERTCSLSAQTGAGVDQLMDQILENLFGPLVSCLLSFPYEKRGVVQSLQTAGRVKKEWADSQGMRWLIEARKNQIRRFLAQNPEITRGQPPPEEDIHGV